MKKVEVKKISLENYKKFQSKSIDLFRRTEISGRNREGKSTIQDAYMDALTGKMADGSSTDSVRTRIAGKEVPKVEVVRELALVIDGQEKTVRKITKQKWRRPRGQVEEVFDGNETAYEVDGFQMKSNQFTEFIQSIAATEVVMMCSNPKQFLGILRKSTAEARKVLEKMSGFSVAELAKSNPKYGIVKEITKGNSVEDTLKKLRKDLNAKKKESDAKDTEIKYESTRKIENEDTSSLKSQKAELESELEKLEEQEKILEDSVNGYNDILYEIRGLESSKNGIVSKADEKLRNKRKEINDLIYSLTEKKERNEADIRANGIRLDSLLKEESDYKKILEDARAKYPAILDSEWDDSELKSIMAEEFDEAESICPTCGQQIPEEQITEKKSSFEEKKRVRIEVQRKDKEQWESRKKIRLSEICDAGNHSAAKLKQLKDETQELQNKINELQNEVSNINNQIKEEQSKLAELPESVDVSNDEEYLAVTARIAELKEKAKAFDDGNNKKLETKDQIRKTLKGISDIDVKIKFAKAAVTDRDKKVIELKEELKEIGQAASDIQQKIDIILDFSIEKNKALADLINQHFKHFQFKFLDFTIEGNPVETCKMICDGIDYFSGLNHSDQILCNIDLVRGLQEMNDVSLPIWVDDSESVNTERFPEIEQQMILLRVTDDELQAKEI